MNIPIDITKSMKVKKPKKVCLEKKYMHFCVRRHLDPNPQHYKSKNLARQEP